MSIKMDKTTTTTIISNDENNSYLLAFIDWKHIKFKID